MPGDRGTQEVPMAERMDAIRDEFERARGAGDERTLAHWLPANPVLAQEVLVELVRVDLRLRLAAGLPARAEEYLSRYPELASDADKSLRVIAAEFQERRRREPSLSANDYRARFPHLAVHPHWENILAGTGLVPVTVANQTLLEGSLPQPSGGLPSIKGYEILEMLGRGGMGVVYKARQVGMGRLVALKVILADSEAGSAQRDRFRTEVEAIARLQHPNIVQVYEVGEYDGKPFFSLEFCPGGSLDTKLAGTPVQPMAAAQLVETLALAMQAAHDKNVLHRDLKPANILLTAEGTLKITDFGLAKKIDEVGQTVSGAIMGTPSYMAPEQARGETKKLGPACDIYALGAILYETLTGRPPFKAGTLLDTLKQVVEDEPVPPRRLQPKIPIDLETICHKCLHKEAARRYTNAAALAEDLRRFRCGEPILARPVSQVERGMKWIRRNPILTGAIGAVTTTLLVATAVSLSFALDARTKAHELAIKTDDLVKKSDALESLLAESLMRPLGLHNDMPMTDQEWDALWELTLSRPGRVGYRLVEKATQMPVTTRQLRNRASLTLPAAVGLDWEARAQVEGLLLLRLDDASLGEEHKKDLIQAAAEWDALTSDSANLVVQHLILGMKKSKDGNALKEWAQTWSALAARMEPKDAAREADPVVAILTQAIREAKQPSELPSLSQALVVVTARMKPKESGLAARQAGAILTQVMRQTQDPSALHLLAVEVSAVAARMDPKDAAMMAAQVGDMMTQAMKDAKTVDALGHLAKGLVAGFPWMETRDAAIAAGHAGAILTQTMKKVKNFGSLTTVGQDLATVAPWIEPKDAADMASVLNQVMKDNMDPLSSQALAYGLIAVTARMEPGDGGALLAQTLSDPRNANAWFPLARGMGIVAARMQTKDAAPAAAVLARALIASKVPSDLVGPGMGLSSVAARLEPKEAANLVATLTQALKDAKPNSPLQGFILSPLSALIARMEPTAAAGAAQAVAKFLIQAMKETKDGETLFNQAHGLASLTALMEPKEAALAAGQTAAILTQAMDRTSDARTLARLAAGISEVVARMEPKAGMAVATQAATLLTKAMNDGKNENVLPALTNGLGTVAVHMAPNQAAATLIQAMADPKIGNRLYPLAQGLTAVAGKLGPKEAAQTAARLATTMQNTKDPGALFPLAQGLAAVAARMEPNEASVLLTQAMQDPRQEASIGPLAQGLASVAARMEPGEATQAAGTLLAALTRRAPISTGPPDLAHSLTQVLTGVSPASQDQRVLAVTAAVSIGTTQPFAPLAFWPTGMEPLACRLTDQQLVDLLKVPTCLKEGRQVILYHLGYRHGRSFGDVWEFIGYARNEGLGLDFRSAPRRSGTLAFGQAG